MSAGRTPSTDEIRQMANSHDGVPPDVFDRWLAAVRAEALREGAVHLRETASELNPAVPSDVAYFNCTHMDAKELDLLADEIEKEAGA